MQLYNIMRPKRFGEMLPTCDTIEAVINDVKRGTLKHTYLFYGPRGCGKTTTARLVAMSYDCEKVGEQGGLELPCGECKPCKRSTSPYTNNVFINGREYGVNEMKSLINEYRSRGLFEGTVVIVIDEAHHLTLEAKNLILDITENPPAHLKWILTTTEIKKFKDDLISRCQAHTFKPLGLEDTKALVSGAAREYEKAFGAVDDVLIVDEVSRKVYNATGGVPRSIIGLVESYLASGLKECVLEQIEDQDEDSNLTPDDRDRFNRVLQIIGANDTISAAKVAETLSKYSGNVEGVRLGLMKYCFGTLSSLQKHESSRINNGVELLEALRSPLNEVYPMRDLLARLLVYVHRRK